MSVLEGRTPDGKKVALRFPTDEPGPKAEGQIKASTGPGQQRVLQTPAQRGSWLPAVEVETLLPPDFPVHSFGLWNISIFF